ncbi:DUF3310 domain-containing protein [Weissella viridescens]|uniref:DUF3310 domain-containing protein n=1 Tax=Weissella viridescens TaxID=1629 RepID=UPI0035274A04
MSDPVKKPKGYQLPSGKELKDVLPDLLGDDGTVEAYKFNAIKYLTRFQVKNGHEDLMKAIEYIKMIDELLYQNKNYADSMPPYFAKRKKKRVKYFIRMPVKSFDGNWNYIAPYGNDDVVITSSDSDLPSDELGFDTEEEAKEWLLKAFKIV